MGQTDLFVCIDDWERLWMCVEHPSQPLTQCIQYCTFENDTKMSRPLNRSQIMDQLFVTFRMVLERGYQLILVHSAPEVPDKYTPWWMSDKKTKWLKVFQFLPIYQPVSETNSPIFGIILVRPTSCMRRNWKAITITINYSPTQADIGIDRARFMLNWTRYSIKI
jgi:hypothetical protein